MALTAILGRDPSLCLNFRMTKLSTPLTWDQLLNAGRRASRSGSSATAQTQPIVRTETERDGDRILFSTPLRRLDDKTQVFPLEQHDSVRNRLTHSHEVASLARSIGTYLAFGPLAGRIPKALLPERNLPAMLHAIALVHDLGNPPFGHQGEVAIQQWFARSPQILAAVQAAGGTAQGNQPLTEAMRNDFLKFEGNAQTFRLVSRLQIVNDDRGLNLTFGTLSALLKYTVPSDKAKGRTATYAGCRKHGYFQSEAHIVQDVRDATGVSETVRHPLTYIMEACDDIAYSVIDAEDALKKGLASFPDLLEFLQGEPNCEQDDASTIVQKDLLRTAVERGRADREELRTSSLDSPLSPSELNDVSMQKFRALVISDMVKAVSDAFVDNLDSMLNGTFTGDLMSASRAALLTRQLKEFDLRVAYRNREVLRLEAHGSEVIHSLMDVFWRAIISRKKPDDPSSERTTAEATYVYARISENYRRAFEAKGAYLPSTPSMPLRYRECQLLTDMIAGMTDRFAVSLYEDLRSQGIVRPAQGS
ncbi:dGTP triphosphohydrolase [Gemmatimonas sp.]|uniref:dGTP triphosphohydrolase n=1 Tax=Gemmatimonas sp. TaxID=1962908 RepID=UPI0039839641